MLRVVDGNPGNKRSDAKRIKTGICGHVSKIHIGDKRLANESDGNKNNYRGQKIFSVDK